MKKLVAAISSVIALSACTANAPTNSPTTSSTPTVSPSYSMNDISKHNQKTDCWFAINNKVYNVTQFIASGMHGGGDTIIEGCGKDATTLFETRPMGSGTAHSEQAKSFLPNFYIGELKN